MSNAPVLPPMDLGAEKSVLGCLMLGGRKVSDVTAVISADDFHADVNQMIFRAILDVAGQHDSDVDVVLVRDRLQQAGQLEDIGGDVFLHECLATVPYHDHALHYAEIVAGHARRRKAIAIGEQLIKNARDLTKDSEDVVEAAHDAAMKMAECLRITHSRPRPISDHVFETIHKYRQGCTPAVFWGIHDIDQMTGGLMLGELVLIGARPSVGKTLLAVQTMDEAARKGIPGLIISEEMSAEMLAMRQLASITDIPQDQWTQSADRIEFDAKEHFSNRATILIAEKCSTATAAERAIDRAVQSNKIRIVAVDYAQLLSGKGENKEQRVANVSSRLKAAAMKHSIIVILLAQLNRQVEQRQGVPQLSDFRDSGGLEQDADVVLFPFWPFKANDAHKDQTEYRIYCRKNRNRGIGEHFVKMRIRPERQRLESIANEFHDDWEAAR